MFEVLLTLSECGIIDSVFLKTTAWLWMGAPLQRCSPPAHCKWLEDAAWLLLLLLFFCVVPHLGSETLCSVKGFLRSFQSGLVSGNKYPYFKFKMTPLLSINIIVTYLTRSWVFLALSGECKFLLFIYFAQSLLTKAVFRMQVNLIPIRFLRRYPVSIWMG